MSHEVECGWQQSELVLAVTASRVARWFGIPTNEIHGAVLVVSDGFDQKINVDSFHMGRSLSPLRQVNFILI